MCSTQPENVLLPCRPAKSEEDGPSHGPHNATRDETYAQDVNSHASRQAEVCARECDFLGWMRDAADGQHSQD
eukprot:scaffold94384_cov17-Tisochrysis_lutea.AAC.2